MPEAAPVIMARRPANLWVKKKIPSLRVQRKDNGLGRSVDGKKLVRRLNCSPQTLEGGLGGLLGNQNLRDVLLPNRQ